MFNYASKKSKLKVWDPLSPWWRKDFYLNDLTSNFQYAKEIRCYGLKDFLINKMIELKKIRYEAQKINEHIWWCVSLVTNITWIVVQIIIYVYLIKSIIEKKVSIGNFTLYLTSLNIYFSNVNNLTKNFFDFNAKSLELNDFRTFMSFEIKENNCIIHSLPVHNEYDIRFKNVSFKYQNSKEHILHDITINFSRGKKVAIVGANGAGKSTFIKLLMGLFEPTSGEILFNNIKLNEIDKGKYYNLFSPIFQDVNNFSLSLKENISMTDSNKVNIDKIKKSVTYAGLNAKINELEKGLDTMLFRILDENGIFLSGGESQKLALARALYKDASIFIFDEPTASMDPVAESKFYENINNMLKEKTVFFITHRLSSTRFCDLIVFFEDGKITEFGSHEELMKIKGKYADLFNMQAKQYVLL